MKSWIINNLKQINDWQIDFEIINLRIYDLLNLIIYFFQIEESYI